MLELITAVRFVVVALLALVIGGVFSVMRLHFRAWKRLPRGAGLTPLHVMLVSLGVLLWGVALAWALIDQLLAGSGLGPADAVARTVLFGVGAVIILVALAVVGGLQRRRVQFAREQKTVVVHTDDTVQVETDDGPGVAE